MFTGIIEEIGKIKSIETDKIEIEAIKVLEDTKIGDSISVNGVCLTVTKLGNNAFYADLSQETHNVTTFCNAKNNEYVNLERAMTPNKRFGGHIVTGHVDGTGKISDIKKFNDFYEIKLSLPESLSKYVVKKGAIALNGISLTVADTDNNTVSLAIIPHTFKNTNLNFLKTGSSVNIETDILARHVEKFLLISDNRSDINYEFLQQNGFV